MEKQLSIQCHFTGTENILDILQKSFGLHLVRILTDPQGLTDEYV